MLPLIIPVGALLTGVAFLLLGSGLLNTLLALKSEMLGYSGTMLGLIMSGYFAGFLLGTWLALPLVARIGHIRSFACCAALLAVSYCLYVLIQDPIAWIAIRLLNGTALVLLYTVIESWLNGQTPTETRARVFAIYMTVNLLALALAQQLLRFDASISHLLFVLAALFVCLSVVPVTLTRMQQPRLHTAERIAPKTLWRAAPAAVLASLLSGLTMGAFWGLTPSYASRIGFDAAQVGNFISCAILGGALLQFPLGRFSDRHDRRLVLASVSLGGAILASLLIVATPYWWLMYTIIALFGGLAFAIYPIAMAHLVDHLPPEDMLAGGCTLLLLYGVGSMFGPLLGGYLLQLAGSPGLPLYLAITKVALAASAYLCFRRGVAETLEDHVTDFVPMVRTTPTMLEMLPPDEEATEPQQNAPWSN